jgi:hypothetical protein
VACDTSNILKHRNLNAIRYLCAVHESLNPGLSKSERRREKGPDYCYATGSTVPTTVTVHLFRVCCSHEDIDMWHLHSLQANCACVTRKRRPCFVSQVVMAASVFQLVLTLCAQHMFGLLRICAAAALSAISCSFITLSPYALSSTV